MTLLQLITALKTTNVKVTVKDDDSEIIIFYSQGINGVEGDVSSRIVKNWSITGAASIEITLDATV